jgi:hypothetical protein
MIVLAPTACMVPPEQLVHQTAYALEHRGTGSTPSGNGTQSKARKDDRHDEQANDKRQVERDFVRH